MKIRNDNSNYLLNCNVSKTSSKTELHGLQECELLHEQKRESGERKIGNEEILQTLPQTN